MEDPRTPKAGAARVGLCLTCRHTKCIETPRSRFWMCGLAAIDSRFEKYPPLPVVECDGYQKVEDAGAAR